MSELLNATHESKPACADFDVAVRLLLEEEGGLVDNPDDPGGLTKYGISQRTYPNIDIRNLTREAAIAIYKRDFWDSLRIEALPAILRYAYFDAAVNCGAATAALFLQRALGVRADGIIGPITRAALDAVVNSPNPAALIELLEEFCWCRAQHHARIAVRRVSSQQFLPGWILRLSRARARSLGRIK